MGRIRRMRLYDKHRRILKEVMTDCLPTRGSFLAQMAQTTLEDIQDLVVAGYLEAVHADLTPIPTYEFLKAGIGVIINLYFRFTPDGYLRAVAVCC